MHKFKEVKNCPKCDRKRFGKSSIAGEKDLDFTNAVYVSERIRVAPGKPSVIIPEHLKTMCNYCGYAWEEECASG